MTYPLTLALPASSKLCVIRGSWRRQGEGIRATYRSAAELELCLALADLWQGDKAAISRVMKVTMTEPLL